jgi:beta-alanine--pyruvate transaminase
MMAAGEDIGARRLHEARRASAMHVLLPQGAQLLDVTAGDGRQLLGHGRDSIAAAVRAAPSGPAARGGLDRLRRQIGALMPPHLDEVAFAASGAQSLAQAIAVAREYHRRRGQTARQRILVCTCRSACDLPPPPLDPQDMFVGRALADITARAAALGPDRIAALLIEPLGMADGLPPPDPAEAEGLRLLCERSGMLLIADETAAALGRVGTATAAQRLGLTPDLVMLGEVLTNNAAPLGAVVARTDMADLLMQGGIIPEAAAVAAALETLAILEDEQLLRRSREIEPYWQQAINSLMGAPVIRSIHGIGLASAIELVPRPGAPGARGQLLFQRSRDYGILTRVRDETLFLTPALVVTKDQIDEIVEKLSAALRKIT